MPAMTRTRDSRNFCAVFVHLIKTASLTSLKLVRAYSELPVAIVDAGIPTITYICEAVTVEPFLY